MDYRLYNAGDTIEETIKFSLSSEARDHATGNWPFRLKSKEFTNIPTELPINDGESTLRTEFPWDIIRKFGQRGVVIVISDKEKKRRFGDGDIPEHLPFATSEQMAVEKGDALWHGYTLNVAEVHVNESQQARAAGGALRKAMGFTSRCLKMHNIVDPADEMHLRMTGGGQSQADVQKMVQDAVAQSIGALVAVPGVREALEAAGAKAPATPAPVVATSPTPAKTHKASGGKHHDNERLPSPQPAKAPAIAGV